MSPEATPPKSRRIAVVWSPEARADFPASDRETALQIVYCLDRYLLHREGNEETQAGAPQPMSGVSLRRSAAIRTLESRTNPRMAGSMARDVL